VIAFVFDRMSASGRDLARKAAAAYLSSGHAPGDLVGVFAVDLVLHVVQPFTSDRDLIRAGFERAASQANTSFASAATREEMRDAVESAGRASAALGEMSQTAGSQRADGSQTSSRAAQMALSMSIKRIEARMERMAEARERDQQGYATTQGLLDVIETLKAIPGRKTVAFFSEGLVIPANVGAQFRAVIASANLANVSVYAMDAGGLRVASPTQETARELIQAGERRLAQLESGNDGAVDGITTRMLERNEDLLRMDPHSGLGQLAEETGGFLISDTNDATGSFRRIEEDMRFHYVLAYSPTNDRYDGGFRSISVRVRRAGLAVQARKGYFATRPAGAQGMEHDSQQTARAERSDRPQAFPLHVQALSFPEPARPGLVPVLVEVPGDAIRYRPQAGGESYEAEFTVVARIRDERGREVTRLSQKYPISASAADFQAARSGNLLFYEEAELPPGRYSVEAVGYDAVARETSTASTSVEVPTGGSERVRLSSIVLPKKVERLSRPTETCAGPLSFGDACLYPSLGEPFRKSESPTIGFFFVVYDTTAPQARRRAIIEVVREDIPLASVVTDLGSADTTGRIHHAGAVPLARLDPGPYMLRITVGEGPHAETRVASFTVAE
jgi:VWFA-related protein